MLFLCEERRKIFAKVSRRRDYSRYRLLIRLLLFKNALYSEKVLIKNMNINIKVLLKMLIINHKQDVISMKISDPVPNRSGMVLQKTGKPADLP